MPRVNTLLLIGVLLFVVRARLRLRHRGDRTMVVTAMMAFVVIWRAWGWPLFLAAALIAPFLFIDLTFLSANLLKIVEGGWMPLALGGVVMAVMYTWRRGHAHAARRRRANRKCRLNRWSPTWSANRQRACTVFVTSDPEFTPTALLHSLKHYKVLHESNVILTIENRRIPRVWTTRNAVAH